MPRQTKPKAVSLRGKLRQVTPTHVQLSHLLCDARVPALLQRSGHQLQAQNATVEPPSPLHRVQLQCDAGALELVVHGATPTLSMAAAPALDTRLRALAAEAVLAPLVEQLQQWGLTGAQALLIQNVAIDQELTPEPQWRAVRNHKGQILTTFAVTQWSAGVFEALMQRLHACPTPQNIINAHTRLTLPGTVVLGTRAVSIDVLRELELGDVLLTTWEARPSSGRSAQIYWGAQCRQRLVADCKVYESSLSIEGEPRMTDESESSQQDSTDPTLETLGELDIPVRFEIETVAIPLANLQALATGYIIELSAPVEGAAIRLMAFGQTIGHAELVAVGDKLGARITKMTAQDDRQSS
jgi:type III secretion protein Q